jgi:hypothetical protein
MHVVQARGPGRGLDLGAGRLARLLVVGAIVDHQHEAFARGAAQVVERDLGADRKRVGYTSERGHGVTRGGGREGGAGAAGAHHPDTWAPVQRSASAKCARKIGRSKEEISLNVGYGIWYRYHSIFWSVFLNVNMTGAVLPR